VISFQKFPELQLRSHVPNVLKWVKAFSFHFLISTVIRGLILQSWLKTGIVFPEYSLPMLVKKHPPALPNVKDFSQTKKTIP